MSINSKVWPINQPDAPSGRRAPHRRAFLWGATCLAFASTVRGAENIAASNVPLLTFGGPDRAPRILRNTLEALTNAAPASSSIQWNTYYFRDMGLARALIRASDRGVRVTMVMEHGTRMPHVNDPVINLLSDHGLNKGLFIRKRPRRQGALHAKTYVFSNPDLALVGSFNPSGNEPEDQRIIEEIGDQDRGYNLLYRIDDPVLVAALRAHVKYLGRHDPSPMARFSSRYNAIHESGPTTIYFYPRVNTSIVEPEIRKAKKGDRVYAAISHLKSPELLNAVIQARRQGADTRLVVHKTERRVPQKVVDHLAENNVDVLRVGDGEATPMHNKFIVLERDGDRQAWLGSYNFNATSKWLNDEVLVRTYDDRVCDRLLKRFGEMEDWDRRARPRKFDAAKQSRVE